MMEVDQLPDALHVIDALRVEGADRFDPVRFHYIEVLAQRASTHHGSVRRILDEKLADAVAVLRQRFEQAHSTAQDAIATPETRAHRETLGDLVRHMAEHSPDKTVGRLDALTTPRAELKSVKYFRNTWSKLSAEKQVAQALGQAPKNAGPINSHVVALRSLALMRETSPDYLNRFMSYVDTLLCLEQSDKPALPVARPSRAAKAAKK
ncbi:MAG: DUF2894 domain-containing protein [Pseudomonadota bacterium]